MEMGWARLLASGQYQNAPATATPRNTPHRNVSAERAELDRATTHDKTTQNTTEKENALSQCKLPCFLASTLTAIISSA
jgi:hypothetical protein